MNDNDNKEWKPKVGERVIAENRGYKGGKREGVVVRIEPHTVLIEFNDGWMGGHDGYAANTGTKNRWWHLGSELSPVWTPKGGERVRLVKDGTSTTGAVGKLATVAAWRDGDFCKGGEYLLDIDPPVDYKTVAVASNFTRATIDCFEPAPLQIVAGRYYKTRDGRKVGPMTKWSDTEHPWEPVGGCKEFNEAGDLWRDDGTSDYSPDIIAEWPADEPVAVAAPTAKFKVGDVVIADGDPRDKGVITIARDGMYAVKWASPPNTGNRVLWEDYELVLAPAAAPTAIVCLIENGQPLPASRPYIHATAGAARREAERLADNHKGQAFGVYVLQGEPAVVAKPEYKHEWQRLAAEGQKVAAVQALRAVADISLVAGKRAVEDWQRLNIAA